MQFERGRWKNYHNGSHDSMNLLENCAKRKHHLEKILFTYNNLHLLNSWYSENAHKAFSSEEPLALWTFENRVILNSRDVDNLMNIQSGFQPIKNNEMSEPRNLVNSLDITYQPANAPTEFSHGSKLTNYFSLPSTMQNVNQQYFPPQGHHVVSNQEPVFPPDFSVPPPTLITPSPCSTSTSLPFDYSTTSSQTSSMSDNFSDLVFDARGYAYKRMIITSTCIVPVKTQQSSACSSYSMPSNHSEPLQRYIHENLCEENQKNYLSGELTTQEPTIDIHTPQKNSQEQTVKSKKTNKNQTALNIEHESLQTQELWMSSSGAVQDNSEDKRSSTPISDIIKYILPSVEGQWKEVSRKKKNYPPRKSSAPLQFDDDFSTPPSMSSTINQTFVAEETEDDTQEHNDKSSSNGKEKLTKRERRLLAKEKAKQLETDDVILEEAMRIKREHESRAMSTDFGISSLKGCDKRRKRPKANMAVGIGMESASVSEQSPPKMSPHVLHAVKMAVHNRAETLRRNGRETTNEHPIRNEYLKKVMDFEDNNQLDRKDTSTAKKFIKQRIEIFREIPHPQSLSRITIYEQLYVGLPRVFLPELCFLNSIISDSQFEIFEEVFFNTF